MIRAHKIRLNPTPEQEIFLRKCCGVARFTYNHALSEWIRLYEAGESPTPNTLRKSFNSYKAKRFPFVLDVGKDVSERAFSDLGKAFSMFFKSKKREGRKFQHPKFKSRKHKRQSFYISNTTIKIDRNNLYIPKLGMVNMSEPLRFDGKIMSGVVSCTAGKWYVSVSVRMVHNVAPVAHPVESVGIDLGLKTLATLSDGTEFENQKFYKSELNQLKRLDRELSRRQRGSNRWWETEKKIQRLHVRIRDRRVDAIHKMTTHVVKTYGFIGIEDLHIAGMVRNRKIALSVFDASMGTVLRQLAYKAEQYGTKIQKVGRFFASSKVCSDCGYINKELLLNDRHWTCLGCGTIHDRDFNASVNIEKEAERLAYA